MTGIGIGVSVVQALLSVTIIFMAFQFKTYDTKTRLVTPIPLLGQILEVFTNEKILLLFLDSLNVKLNIYFYVRIIFNCLIQNRTAEMY